MQIKRSLRIKEILVTKDFADITTVGGHGIRVSSEQAKGFIGYPIIDVVYTPRAEVRSDMVHTPKKKGGQNESD